MGTLPRFVLAGSPEGDMVQPANSTERESEDIQLTDLNLFCIGSLLLRIVVKHGESAPASPSGSMKRR
jgi:hypothetical protein